MSDPKLRITATDETRAAFASVASNLDRLKGSALSLNGALAGLAAVTASVGGLVSVFRETVNAADALSKLSQRTGITVEKLSELKYAGDLSDVSLEQLQLGVRNLSDVLTKAGDATSREAALLRTLGVTSRDPLEAIRQISDAIAALPDGIIKTQAVSDVFGARVGQQLIPLLNSGSKGLDDMGESARRLGRIFTTETAKASEEFNDNLTKLSKESQTLGIALTENLVKGLAAYTTELVKAREQGALFSKILGDIAEQGLKAARNVALPGGGNELLGRLGDVVGLSRDLAAADARADVGRRTAKGRIDTGFVGPPEPPNLQFRQLEDRLRALFASKAGGGAKGASEGEQFLSGLRKQLAGLEEDAYGLLRYEAALKGVSAAAEPLIQQLQKQSEFRRELAAATQRDAAALEQERQRRRSIVNSVDEYVQGLEAETKLLGLSNEERIVATQLLKLEAAGWEKNSENYAKAASLIRSTVFTNAGAQLRQELKSPTEKLADETQRLRELYAGGGIDAATFWRAVAQLNEEFAKTTDGTKSTEDAIRQLGLTFTSAFEEAITAGGSFRDILSGIEKDLLRLGTRKLVTEPLLKSFEGLVSGGGGLPGLLGLGGGTPGSANFVGPLQPGTTSPGLGTLLLNGIQSLLGFANGGTFTVGGAGGVDSQVVAFRATPGERVDVTPPGRAAGGSPVNVVINMPPNVTRDTVMQAAARFGQVAQLALRRNR